MLLSEVRPLWTYLPTDELYHYGVLGMKWGVRHEEKTSSNSRNDASNNQKGLRKYSDKWKKKSEQNQKDIDDLIKNGEKSSYIKSKYGKKLDNLSPKRKQRILDGELKDLQKQKKKNDTVYEARSNGKLTSKEKAIVIGGAFVAAYATYKIVDSGSYHEAVARGKSFVTGKGFDFKKDSSLSGNLSLKEIQDSIVKKVNPGYGDFGTKNNCRRCTMAYEMSRRGYDVSATKTVSATGQTVFGVYSATSKKDLTYLDRVKMAGKPGFSDLGESVIVSKPTGTEAAKRKDAAEKIFDAISKNPERARGELAVGWDVGGGHSMVWEIIDKKPVIFDCQTGDTFDSPESFKKYGDRIKTAALTRLDNKDINKLFVSRWVQNAE